MAEETVPVTEEQNLPEEKLITPQESEQIDEIISIAPLQTKIAGFWERVFAFIIDSIIIIIPLIIVGSALREFFYVLGPWGRLIGYTVIISYWGYFNSKKKAGQTFGKRIIKIAVVDKNNQYLSLGKSFTRAFTLGLISMLNGWAIPVIQQNSFIALVVTIIVFGGILTLLYGLIFNRTTRQGIHDLFAKSYVIKAPPNTEALTPAIPNIHLKIMYGLLGIALLIGIGSFILQQNKSLAGMDAGEWKEIQEVQSALLAEDEFFSASVMRSNRYSSVSSVILRDLNIEVWSKISCNRDPDYCEELIERIARTAFTEYNNLDQLSGMRISITNRFDLGMASGTSTQGISWSMEDWQNALIDGFKSENPWK